MNRYQRTGFTLIETVWALVVGALVLFTMTLVLQQLKRNVEPKFQGGQQLDNAVMHLASPELKLRYLSSTEDDVQMTGENELHEARVYWLKWNNEQLILTTNNGGYMPLVENVQQLVFTYKHHCLFINMKIGKKNKAVQTERLFYLPEAPDEGKNVQTSAH